MGHISHLHPASVDAVFALLTDEAFLRARAENAGDRNIKLTVTPDGDKTKIALSRDVVTDIPSFAKKIFEPTNLVEEETVWEVDGDKRRGRFKVKVGDRVSLNGTLLLEPEGGQCRFREDFTAEVKVALIGKRLVGFVEGETEKAVKESCRFTDTRLRQG